MTEETVGHKEVSPSVRYLVSVITERIQSGKYIHGRWLPSERALADEFSVCRPTIRQAIAELERRHLIQRSARHRPVVWGVPGETPESVINGSPQPVEADNDVAPTRPSASSIGIWISGSPADMGPIALTNGVHQALAEQEHPFRVVIGCPQGGDHTETLQSERAALARMADDPDIGGIILWYLGGEENRSALERLRASGKRMVFVDREPPVGFEADFVGVHNIYAATEAVRYLLRRGHRNIAHLTNQDRASTVLERRQGYEQALRQAGIAIRADYILTGPFRVEREEEMHWQRLVEQLRGLPDPPTAVFAINDYTAWQLIRTLRGNGIRVPEDLAVMGFDNTERWSALDPFMSSVSQPFDQMGIEAAKLLALRLQHPKNQTYRHLLLPAELVIRTSTG